MTDCFSSIDFGWGWCLWLAEVEGGGLFTEQPWARWDLADIFVGGGRSLPRGLVSCLGFGMCPRYWRHSLHLVPSAELVPPAPKGRRDQTKLVLMRNVVMCASAGLLLSDTITTGKACLEAWGKPGIVLQSFRSLPVSSYSASLKSYLCTERSWRCVFSALQFVSECLGAQL